MKNSICIVTEEHIPFVYRFSLSLRLSEALSREMEVHLISLSSSPGFTVKNVHFHPVKVDDWDLFNLKKRIEANLKLIKEIYRVSSSNKIDLIYGWWLAVFIGAAICGKPFVVDMPEFIEEMYRSFKQPFKKIMGLFLKCLQILAARRSKGIMVESQTALEEWIKRRIPKERLSWAPYGVETENFDSVSSDGIRDRYKIPTGRILLMYHGDIGIDDGVDLLISALNGLDAYLLCIGDGPRHYVDWLKSISNPRVIFTGWIPYEQIPSFMAAADIYVAPFRRSFYTDTTFPLKQMEAMAAGKATVCSRINAFSKYVKDDYDIKLVEPENAAELRKAIFGLIENKDKRLQMGRNARQTALNSFNWRKRIEAESIKLKGVLNSLKNKA